MGQCSPTPLGPFQNPIPSEGSLSIQGERTKLAKNVFAQLSVEAPTANNRAIFHLTTIRFPSFAICEELGPLNATMGTWDMCASMRTSLNSQGSRNYYGKNILGTSGWIDIERTYDMTKSMGKSGSTGNLTTHMQVDKIDVDFGFITNAGMRTRIYNFETQFRIRQRTDCGQ